MEIFKKIGENVSLLKLFLKVLILFGIKEE